jgi:single-stranded DNA-binding protein
MGRIPSQSARVHKNEARIAGLLSKDPELRNTQSGEAVASLTVAIKFKESTEYHRVTCWEQLAEKCVVNLSDLQGGVIWRLFFR